MVIIITSLVFRIPLSCLISYVDRKRAERDEDEWEWKRTDELIHPSDRRRIIHVSARMKYNTTYLVRIGILSKEFLRVLTQLASATWELHR